MAILPSSAFPLFELIRPYSSPLIKFTILDLLLNLVDNKMIFPLVISSISTRNCQNRGLSEYVVSKIVFIGFYLAIVGATIAFIISVVFIWYGIGLYVTDNFGAGTRIRKTSTSISFLTTGYSDPIFNN